MRLSLSNSKSTKDTNRGACIRAASIGSTYIKDPYTRSIDTRDIDIDSTFAKYACVISAYIGNSIAIEHSKICLQLSWILEVR